ncbi:hypothetical protein U9M48_018266 [Paspalum notatum var. saurae]|uniref:Replication protein A OB domain-containing protein n=1 Tax=Paspalum notatum var. saurae TaxID=547442 RepID=A0AAQ3WQ58_PASNO
MQWNKNHDNPARGYSSRRKNNNRFAQGSTTMLSVLGYQEFEKFHGKNDDDTIKHLDLVIIDQKDFPKYTFLLTPFTELPKLEGNNEYFIDVIGRVTALSDATQFTTTNGDVRMKRLIHLMDLRGNKIEISLWGPRAGEFPGDQILQAAACRWYINLPEIHKINAFYASIGEQHQPIEKLYIQTTNQMQGKIEQKTLLQMKSVDPFDDVNKRFECTMTITRIADNEPWCYQGCTKCTTSVKHEGNSYVCKNGHVSSQMIHRYKISLYGTDGTYELEFMVFDERGTLLVGKTADKLLIHNSKSEIPPEIGAIVGEKMTVVVKVSPGKSINKKGPNRDNKDPTFDILNIKKRHGKDLLSCTLKNEEAAASLATNAISQLQKLPPLVPIQPKTQETKVPRLESTSPNDLQLIEIDQISPFHDFSPSRKRDFNATDDSDLEETHDVEQLIMFAKRVKTKD